MIGTIMKHEFARTRGILAMAWGFVTAGALLGVVMALTRWSVVAQLGGVLVSAFGVAHLFVMIWLALEHWSTSFGPNGYLTQMVPVKGSTLLAGKFLYALVVSLLAVLLWLFWGMVSWLLSFWILEAPWWMVRDVLVQELSAIPGWLYAVGTVVVVLLVVSFLSVLYAAAALGSIGRLAGRRWGPGLVGFLLYVVMLVLLFVGILAVPYGLGTNDAGQLSVQPLNMWEAMVSSQAVDMMPLGYLPVLILSAVPLLWAAGWAWNNKVSLR